jgi:quercetin dioxygenase-like cupin family protein
MKRLIYGICLTLMISSPVWGTDVTSVQVDTLSKSTLSWNGAHLPAYPEGTPEITILKIIIPPGATLPVHNHPVINAGVLLSGQLTVFTETNKVLHLKAGESLIEVVDTWHYGKNEGDKPAEIIVFYAGVLDTPITVKK